MIIGSNAPFLMTIISVIAAPAVVALGIAFHTGDPTLRPLGITIEKMTRVSAPAEDWLIEAELHWPATRKDTTPALDIAQQIKRTFEGKGHNAWIVVLSDPTIEHSYVLYRVGNNEIGPYSLVEAAKGVMPTIAAVRGTPR